MKIEKWTSSNKKNISVNYKWKKIVTNNGVIIMSKVINLFDYKKKVQQKQSLPLTKEERMKIKEDSLYDDDTYLDMFFDQDDDFKEM
ncbi:conserved hypothetical protein [Clostridium botulinum C str. Eklund]|uniref:hypothetical protein n=1 Tax=Clostridium botulinum TaxID=1491 RepID=UPI00016641CD|nr:hypothetical protein [Clostridium botulinum]EDS77107.1 conserved hypothetical protein [Clostridium botulinum C str. Eklund]KEH99836.1 hypothetical protein Z952_p0166 [Clostridium botulinum C/D str. BKT75002]KEI05314.1 hypothetical protein Z954_0167 [Clostridium botulinum C/D str. BKT2873]QPW62002.1 hypothetical protein IG390_14205 [Clostridium botulinum]